MAYSLPSRIDMTQPWVAVCTRLSLLLLGAAASSGCPAADSELVACEPLATTNVPLELGTVIAVGKAKDGTLFAADQPGDPGELRLFVSEGKALVRHEINGSGEQSEGTLKRIGLTVGGDAPFTLLIELGGAMTRMMVVEGPLGRDKNLNISNAQGEALEVVSKGALDSLVVQNLPGDVQVEYSARVRDGARLIVTRPEHDWSYEDFRVFFGPADRVEERHVTSVTRALDGGSTHIDFKVGSEAAVAFFPSRLTIDGVTPDEPDTLEISAKSFEIERLPMDALELDGLTFECFR
jgi:hypothetical protein